MHACYHQSQTTRNLLDHFPSMRLSNNQFDCSSCSFFVVIIICFISSETLASTLRYVRNDSNGYCTTKLLENVKDSGFSASSVLRKDPEFSAHAARIDLIHDSSGIHRAWCPDKLVSNVSTEWLQIEFNSTKIIKNIFTQGRDDGNYGDFVTNYYFDYQRESGLTWYRYNDTNLGELITANNDPRNTVYKKFDFPLVANRIRIIPISVKPKKVCLRVGLYGCDFNDGVVEYQIPRGDSMIIDSKLISFDDTPYDGNKFSNETWLQGGMGKLMDNVVLINSTKNIDLPQFVVAWKKRETYTSHVNLFFRFQTARQLKFMKIYSTENSNLSIHFFKSLVIDFFNEEKGLSRHTGTLEVPTPYFVKNQPVVVDLKRHVSNLVKIRIYFSSDWIALNEVLFSSEVYMIKPPHHATILTTHASPITESKLTSRYVTKEQKQTYISQKLIYYIILITCVIGFIVLTGVGLFICFFWIKHRQKRRYKNKFFDHRSMLFNDPYQNTCDLITIAGNNPLLYRPLTPHSYAPPISNAAQNMGLRFVHSQFPPCPDYCPSTINEYEAIDSYWPKTLNKSISFTDHKQEPHDRQTLLSTTSPDLTSISKNVPVYCSTSSYSSQIYSQANNEIVPISSSTQESLNGIFKIHLNNPLKGPFGSTISNFQLAPASQKWIDHALQRIPEIQASQIKLGPTITEGEIAAITSGHIENTHVDILVVRYKPNNLRLDFKSLFYRQCFAKLREDYSSHPNLLSIIGQCLIGGVDENTIPSIIYAYPSQINIVTFFKKLHLIPRKGEISFACSYVSQSSLLYLAKQLAGALSYLSEIGVVHKDVSARNCSIGENFHLILSDFAIGIEEFDEDYIPIRSSSFNSDLNENPVTVRLPLLWMPWETIIMGNYSTKSDIWSFGVTVWEIFTECQTKPYSTLYNHTQDPSINILNIINNSMLIANNHPSSILPNNRTLDLTQTLHDKPSQIDSSRQIREIMTECWRFDPAIRPNFQKLYSLLCNLIPTSKPLDEYGALYQLIG